VYEIQNDFDDDPVLTGGIPTSQNSTSSGCAHGFERDRFNRVSSGGNSSQCAMVFSLAAQSGIFYSGFTAVTEPVKAPDESRLACARRGAAVSDRVDLTQIEPAEKL